MPVPAVTEMDIQEICDKTTRLLFEGANPYLKDIREAVVCEEMEGEEEEIEREETGEQPRVSVCRCGNRDVVKLVMVCDHCQFRVCGERECLRECSTCQRKLCHLCSILNYSSKQVQPFCLDCNISS